MHTIARSKKLRMSAPPSDEDEDHATSVALSQRISRFAKSPVKGGRNSRSELTSSSFQPSPSLCWGSTGRSRASDDDDFVVSDSPSPVASRSSSRSGHSSPTLSDEDDFIVDSDEGGKPKKKTKSKAVAKRQPLKKGGAPPGGSQSQAVGESTGGSGVFLTAAERRARDNKVEKKAQEDPFDFLQDIRDVSTA
jgi:DNA mismatch repair protein MSH6